MIRLITGIIIIFFFHSCNNSNVKEIDLKLNVVTEGSIFSLDTINTQDWDRMHVVKPYDRINLSKFKMPESILNELNSISITDSYCSLLFIKTDQLVNYAIISRNVADFSGPELEGKNLFSYDQVYKITEDRKIILLQ